MDQMLTVQQAFDAMRLFLAQFNEREPAERRVTIEQLLRWTEQATRTDGGTADPAQWDDWLAAIRAALGQES